MEERGIQMGLGLGGITTPMCELLEKGLIRTLVDLSLIHIYNRAWRRYGR